MAQVWPSEYGVHKPFWFPLDPNYWFPEKKMEKMDGTAASPLAPEDPKRNVPTEEANETVLGAPSIIVDRLRKTFSSGQVAVNDLSFKMYADQIFVLVSSKYLHGLAVITLLPILHFVLHTCHVAWSQWCWKDHHNQHAYWITFPRLFQ